MRYCDLLLGAYGAAVLYRKKDDDSYVILKEINLHDLTAGERQMALNEVFNKILSSSGFTERKAYMY